MQITKQDMLILLQGGGTPSEQIAGAIPAEGSVKVLKQSNQPRVVILMVQWTNPFELFISFTENAGLVPDGVAPLHPNARGIPSIIFLEKEKVGGSFELGYDIYKIPVHPKDQLYLHSTSPEAGGFYAAVFTLPQYVLEAPSIKEVDIVNTFNIPLEGQ